MPGRASRPKHAKAQRWGGKLVGPGERVDSALHVGESYLGLSVSIPFHVWRAHEPGPTLLLTGAVHGDELNGTGAIRQILLEPDFELERGTLVLAPVVNVPGFERHTRYLPDRRDLNRSFPGSATGSLTGRLARVVFEGLLKRCDYCIDLHTAAVRRTNFPNVRADMDLPEVKRIARAFGAEVIIRNTGTAGSLRCEANGAGCATILLEAGEVWKFEPAVVEFALRGIRNVLRELGMTSGDLVRPAYQTIIRETRWIRAPSGGFLRFHVSPGEFVDEKQPIATATSLLGDDVGVIESPVAGLVIGQTTLPAVSPGDPVAHIAMPADGQIPRIERALRGLSDESLGNRLRTELATNVMTSPAEEEGRDPNETEEEGLCAD